MIMFDGIGAEAATFLHMEAVAGAPCTLMSDAKVYGSEEGDAIHGVCLWVRDKLAGVQVRGFVTLPLQGSAPEVGYAKLCAGADGKVKADTTGREFLVVGTNSADKTITFML